MFYLVLQLGQEEGEQMLHSVVLAQDRGKAHDDRGQGRLHMLICVRHQLLLEEQRGSGGEKNQSINSQVLLIRDKVITFIVQLKHERALHSIFNSFVDLSMMLLGKDLRARWDTGEKHSTLLFPHQHISNH